MDLVEKKLRYYNDVFIKRHSSYIRNKYIRGCAKFFNYAPVEKKYAGKNVLTREETNDAISKLIDSGAPFAVSRFGSTELINITYYYMKNILKIDGSTKVWTPNQNSSSTLDEQYKEAMNGLSTHSGFFPPEEEYVKKFCELYLGLINEVDILGTWDIYLEEFFINQFMPKTALSNLYYLEPWFSNNPWSYHLKEKRVLVIHPFEETIISQYQKRKLLFKDERVLPDFELKTIAAVQTLAGNKDGRFENWFDALEYMYQQAIKIEFDVAIIGCGAYGMPLALMLKKAGKQAIHLGGATQLMFGIKGSRWEQPNYPTKIGKMFNSSWVRPQENEKIKNKEKIENACYW